MPRGFRSITFLIWVLAASVSVYAQTNTPPLTGALPAVDGATVQNPDLHTPITPLISAVSFKVFPVLAGKPFKADVHVHRVATFPHPVVKDGKPVSIDGVMQTEMRTDVQDTHNLLARDSLGRVTERVVSITSPASGANPPMPDIRSRMGLPPGPAGISDPVAMVYWSWDFQPNRVLKSRIAASALQTPDQPLTRCILQNDQTTTPGNNATQHFEDLGERTIQNLVVRGCRITTTRSPVALNNNSGEQQQQQRVTTLENWVSPELRAIVLSIERSYGNEETRTFENIAVGDPDPSLFTPPPDYSVEDLNDQRDTAEGIGAQLEQAGIRGDDIAGPWETEDPIVGKNSQIGISLRFRTERAVRFQQGAVTETGAQAITGVQFDVYQGMGGQYDNRWFQINEQDRPDAASWDGKTVRVNFSSGREMPLPGHQRGAFANTSVGLELTFNPQERSWVGTYSLNGTTKQVRLMRPAALSKTPSSQFVGTWESTAGPGILCTQIAQRQDGSFTAWRNFENHIPTRQIIRRSASGPIRIPPVGTIPQEYGMLLIATVEGSKLTLEEGGGMGTGLSAVAGLIAGPFKGTLSADGSQIIGESPNVPVLPGQPSPSPRPQILTRVSSGGCSASPPAASAPQ